MRPFEIRKGTAHVPVKRDGFEASVAGPPVGQFGNLSRFRVEPPRNSAVCASSGQTQLHKRSIWLRAAFRLAAKPSGCVILACGAMKGSLIIISFVVLLALWASVIAFTRQKTVLACLQLIGSAFLAVMVCTHFAETYGVFPQMGWGLPHSAGHYIDLVSVWGGVTLFVLSYLLRKLAHRRV